MKSVFLAGAVAFVLAGASQAAAVADADELALIRAQLQALMERVDKLEQENSSLESQNEELQVEGDRLRAEARGLRKDTATHAVEVAGLKGADRAGRIALKGDLRYRHEQISDETRNAAGVQRTADRSRQRVRARLNAQVQATEDIQVGIGFATSEDGDPRSSNQTLGEVFSRKSISLDTAYFDWSFADWGHLIGGKMKQPFVLPGQSLFWDSDINPEGLALKFASGPFFGAAYGYWIDEVSGARSAVTADTMLYGGQLGARLPVGAGELMLAAHYYDLSAGQGRAPFFDGDANGNTTIELVPGSPVLLHDYQVVNLSAELDTKLAWLPVQLWADAARNQDAEDLDTAWAAGVLFGEASDAGGWELGAAYQVVEKDALFAQLIDADVGGGVTDAEGWVFSAGYAPVKNWILNATYLLNKRNRDVANPVGQTDVDYDRLQLDFNLKF